MNKTYMAKPGEIQRKWYILDATDKPLGRLAAEAARILRGKHRPQFTPHVDTGDHVIVINAEKVILTGNKLKKKKYIRHSGYPGGLKVTGYDELLARRPELAVRKAIVGMLPHNRLGARMAKKLRVYRGENHPHQAQKPEVWSM
ncbi:MULTISPECIES: 50S ribosomal protein L13 [Desulfofundulus]|jgi:large subunit ribosomal protein L13|uniref:Large ribosomal subunit protein uL13 n=2 Tax=Desulfofundulus TaxID=2282741 RepID=A0A494WT40_9FIRM|nr:MULTISPECIES: 50S ribosomal protein L13 [Desulfofundulus]AEG16519.1 ribosomal protein L13 [Desulfofundulus kuznetsovii DSM 6115]NHM28523.1 50S ribosomal protein L13 [Desulfofundulus sp. TPOSR]RKO65933.1 50S ribosomal protein L13 [Desulfofundulus salinum]